MNLEVLATAIRERMGGLAYAGEVSSQETWDALEAIPEALLVDVRTQPEWVFAGLPNLTALGKQTVQLSWRLFPANTINPDFQGALSRAVLQPDVPLFFICRTGGRSLDAAVAMTQQGYTHCFNVTDGFDGPLSESGHRGEVAGWKAAGLPWVQG